MSNSSKPCETQLHCLSRAPSANQGILLRASRASAHRIAFAALLLCSLATSSIADHTRRWRQSTYEEFLKGTAKGVAVRSDGHLELAPKFTLVADADASYLWSLRTDPSGVLYAGGGSPAKVFRFDTSGKPKTVFESTDLLAQSIAFDAKGGLYVGTSPDGKVYKVSANGEKTVFFEPKTKYIWDLAFAADGTLYVATGDKGQIYAVSPDGKGEIYYASDEAHIKVLTFDTKGNLLAGTEPNGRVLRIGRTTEKGARKSSPGTAEGFVLYETAKREITSLAVGADGNIYVAAIGDKPRAGLPGQPGILSTPPGVTTFTNQGLQPGAISAPFVAYPQAISSSIYRITAGGVPEEIWTSREDIVFSLGLNPDGRLLAGTGNNGSLLVIDGHGVYAQLAKAGSSQITGISSSPNGKVYLCTANPGKVFSLGPEYEAQGTFESQSFDAKLFSEWGRLEWWGPPGTTEATKNAKDSKEPRLEFYVRSGNTEDPGKEWSAWFGPYISTETPVEAPAARFLQWKAVIHDGRPGDGIDWVSVTYLPKNVAPVIDGIAMQDPGVRAQAPLGVMGQPGNVTLKPPPAPSPNPVLAAINANPSPGPKFELQPQGSLQKGYQSVLWSAHDDNDDDLKYAVYFRGENQRDWLLLKDNLDQKFYSWDTTSMPDGAYYLKIVASDAPSNPPELALKAERESERFEIDNTPPAIGKIDASLTGMNADRSHGVSYDFQFTASHPTNSIERAQYSVDGGEWILLRPSGGISDYRNEAYSFTVRGLSPGEHTIVVRAYDRFDNVGSAKATIEVAGTKN
jgi:outer membrane protein assembly factor BamB